MSERKSVDVAVYEAAARDIKQEFVNADTAQAAHQIVCGILYDRFDHYSWVGIYVVVGDDLVLSAWAGPEETEHTRIPVGAGICGLAAETGQTELVPDVSERDEFIACFPSTRSEIVVPIHGREGVVGEIDIDSDDLDAFDEVDRAWLERLAARLSEIMG